MAWEAAARVKCNPKKGENRGTNEDRIMQEMNMHDGVLRYFYHERR